MPTFTNRTTVFNLETQLTQKVRAEFIGRGTVPDSAGADGRGCAAHRRGVVGHDHAGELHRQQLASRYIITMTARVELRDLRDNKVLWENPGLVFRQEYDAQGQTAAGTLDPAAFFGQDLNALDRISTDFARTIVSAILEAF